MALAVLGLLAALIPVDTWLRVVLVSPMVLLLPGYAITAIAFFPRTLPASERLVYTVALSLAATAFTGVAVQLVLGLDRVVWAIFLSLAVLGTASAALARREREGILWGPPQGPLAVYLKPAAPVLIAAGLAILSISIASHGAQKEREDIHFTQLWALPQGNGKVAIGVANDEGATASYRLRVLSDGTTLVKRKLRVPSGGSRTLVISTPPISAEHPLRVVLARNGEIYRRVQLRNEVLP